ncbi:protein of unknown function [Cupriavidus taiwanensis]|nr:protein of unknown function [Cupriavidus taiwanensis]
MPRTTGISASNTHACQAPCHPRGTCAAICILQSRPSCSATAVRRRPRASPRSPFALVADNHRDAWENPHSIGFRHISPRREGCMHVRLAVLLFPLRLPCG